MNLYTLGHSNHPIERFLQLLSQNGITNLADVRSTPYSRFHPQYNQAALQTVLAENHIEYIYMGDTLGGRPQDPACYLNGMVPKQTRDYLHEISYPKVMQRPWFIQGAAQLLDMAGRQAVCILCSEGEPLQCHRHHLVARYLITHNPEIAILHILRDGGLVDARRLDNMGDSPQAQQLHF